MGKKDRLIFPSALSREDLFRWREGNEVPVVIFAGGVGKKFVFSHRRKKGFSTSGEAVSAFDVEGKK